MSFLYPLGLLGLIGIPILIVIYIIKSKYTEQTVSSTYLWTLSERFLRKRNPITRVTGFISLVLQILAVAAISLAIAHPTLIIPDSANEYCFILDGSGSMNMESGGKSRFERGKERIAELVEDSVDGSIYSLIYVSDKTALICEKTDDKKQTLLLLDELKAGYDTDDFTDALGAAQSYFDSNPSVKTYLVTDCSYEESSNIEIIDLSENEYNASVYDCSYVRSGKNLTVSGKLTSYGKDVPLKVSLYADGGSTPLVSKELALKAEEITPFELTAEADSFSYVRVAIENKDSLLLDNEAYLYDIASQGSNNTLVVSDRPLFISSVLNTVINAKVDTVSTKDYKGQSGYGLYVFDSYSPEVLPKDGAIWIINPTSSISESGFSVQGEMAFTNAEPLEISGSSSSVIKGLKREMSGDTVYISRYVKCGLYSNFSVLYSYKGNPVIFAGSNSNGNREVVFAFDLHDSNLPLLYDYVVMAANMVSFSFPDTVERTAFSCGEEVEINLPVGCQSVRVDTPDKNIFYLDTESGVSAFVPTEVGVYTVTLTVENTQKSFCVFAGMKEAERDPSVSKNQIGLQGEDKNEGFDGRYDMMTALFIAIAFLFLADWTVYCYEKYQLR